MVVLVCTPLGDKMSLLYGLQKQGEAYLLPTSGLPRHRYQSINQVVLRPQHLLVLATRHPYPVDD